MPEQAFEVLYDEIRKGITVYTDPGGRIGYIAGYLRGMGSDAVITIDQVICILNLRYPEKGKAPVQAGEPQALSKLTIFILKESEDFVNEII